MQLKALFFWICVLCTFSLIGQKSRIIDGYVYDVETKEPLIGVFIYWHSHRTVKTDTSGYFSINVPNSENVLKTNFINYKHKEILINGASTISIYLDKRSKLSIWLKPVRRKLRYFFIWLRYLF